MRIVLNDENEVPSSTLYEKKKYHTYDIIIVEFRIFVSRYGCWFHSIKQLLILSILRNILCNQKKIEKDNKLLIPKLHLGYYSHYVIIISSVYKSEVPHTSPFTLIRDF